MELIKQRAKLITVYSCLYYYNEFRFYFGGDALELINFCLKFGGNILYTFNQTITDERERLVKYDLIKNSLLKGCIEPIVYSVCSFQGLKRS